MTLICHYVIRDVTVQLGNTFNAAAGVAWEKSLEPSKVERCTLTNLGL
jgi:hypothetical protein